MSTQLLTEEQSAEIAGVSIDTLKQYKDFGLLEPVWREGVILFKESEIRTLFYTSEQGFRSREQGHNPKSVSSPEAQTTSLDSQKQSPDANSSNFAAESTATIKADILSSSPITLDKVLEETPKETAGIVESLADTASATIPPETGAPRLAKAADEQQSASISADSELLDLNRILREQIQILREERDWLRARVEKLEARSEREQMLILAESENVRSLIGQKRQKSIWRLALPWFGLDSAQGKGEQ